AAEDAFGVSDEDLETDGIEEESIQAEDDGDDFGASEEFEADEVTDDEADAFEEKINASIEEQQSFGEAEELHSEERLEAMKLVESGDFKEESKHSPEDFED